MEVYLFPYDKVNKDEKIIIWGLGIVGKEYISQLSESGYASIVLIIDSNVSTSEYKGYKVVTPDKAMSYFDICDRIVIAISKESICNDIKQRLENVGVLKDRIVSDINRVKYDESCWIDAFRGKRSEVIKKMIENEDMTIVGLPQFLEKNGQREEYDRLNKMFVKENPDNDTKDYSRLVFLWKNMEYVLNRVSGNIAELGVYKGSTACILAEYAEKYNRKLYLFDSFSGFDRQDMIFEGSATENHFKDTSIEQVKSNVGHADITRYYMGFFPDTVDDVCENDQYAIVHIDFDLYKPIKAALDFFWPKINVGGIVVVHDYLSGRWQGATKAVDEFVEINEINGCVLMPDLSGSVVIPKTRI